MDVNVLYQLIGSLGFPIVACGYMMVTMNKTIQANTEATNHMVSLMQSVLDHFKNEHGVSKASL